MKRVHEYNEI